MATSIDVPAGWVKLGESRHASAAHWRIDGSLAEGADFVWVCSQNRPKTCFYNPASLDREAARRESRNAASLKHSHLIEPVPPRGGIGVPEACRKYGLARDTLWKLVEADEVSAGRSATPNSQGMKPVLVSGPQLAKAVAKLPITSCPAAGPAPLSDGVTTLQLATELETSDQTIRRWLRWVPHPAIGRAIRRETVPRRRPEPGDRQSRAGAVLVSRSDVAECLDVAKRPLNRAIPGNPGEWIAEGIFRHCDGRLFFTTKYIRLNKAKYGLPPRSVFLKSYFKRLESIRVVWPQAKAGKGGWKIFVFSEESLKKLVERREGVADGGNWLVPDEIWNDSEGLWFSTSSISRQTGWNRHKVKTHLRDAGVIGRYKSVHGAKPKGGKKPGGGGGLVVVHHESEIRPLLGIGDQAHRNDDTEPVTSKDRTKTGRRANPKTAEVYAFCFERKQAGDKLANIVREAQRRFGARAPKDKAAASIYAKRHATKPPVKEGVNKTQGG